MLPQFCSQQKSAELESTSVTKDCKEIQAGGKIWRGKIPVAETEHKCLVHDCELT